MPELPDVTVYLEALAPRVLHQPLLAARVASPFVVRTFDPPLKALEGRVVTRLERLGKRIVLGFSERTDAARAAGAAGEAGAAGAAGAAGEERTYLVIHLMVAGRLRWLAAGAKLPGKLGLLGLDFPSGTLVLTEAGTKKRASVHVVRGEAALAALGKGGLEPMTASLADFAAAPRRERHTLKRALTDPRILSGIGNAYSDEILHAARLSPVTMTDKLPEADMARLFEATRSTLSAFTERLRKEVGEGFPEKVTAFRPDMAVHGRYGEPCPRCGAKVARIAYADNETNYCAPCQTGGKLLADRGLSRLLGKDWPRSLEELEEHIEARKAR